jgi:hypothetical protein
MYVRRRPEGLSDGRKMQESSLWWRDLPLDINVDGETPGNSAPVGAPAQGSSIGPTQTASQVPSSAPSLTPSSMPTLQPSSSPSFKPSKAPSGAPSIPPTEVPSMPSMPPTTTPSMVASFSPSEGRTEGGLQDGLFVTAPTNPREFNPSESNPHFSRAFLGPAMGVATISIGVILLLFFAFGTKKANKRIRSSSRQRNSSIKGGTAKEEGGGDDIVGGSRHPKPPVETAHSMDLSTLYDSPSQKADETFFQYSVERQRTNATTGSQLSVLQSIIGCGAIPEGDEDDHSLALESGDGLTSSRQISREDSIFTMFFPESFSQSARQQ